MMYEPWSPWSLHMRMIDELPVESGAGIGSTLSVTISAVINWTRELQFEIAMLTVERDEYKAALEKISQGSVQPYVKIAEKALEKRQNRE